MGDRSFRVGDRVIQRRNNYNLNVFNGDIGQITAVDPTAVAVEVTYRENVVAYERDDIRELGLAYAITIHKSQGSEFDGVIIPIVTQHYMMLFRNLIYTGLTRAKRLAFFVGSHYALRLAVQNIDSTQRQTALRLLLAEALSACRATHRSSSCITGAGPQPERNGNNGNRSEVARQGNGGAGACR